MAALKNISPSVPFGRRSLRSVPAFPPLGWDAFIWLSEPAYQSRWQSTWGAVFDKYRQKRPV